MANEKSNLVRVASRIIVIELQSRSENRSNRRFSAEFRGKSGRFPHLPWQDTVACRIRSIFGQYWVFRRIILRQVGSLNASMIAVYVNTPSITAIHHAAVVGSHNAPAATKLPDVDPRMDRTIVGPSSCPIFRSCKR